MSERNVACAECRTLGHAPDELDAEGRCAACQPADAPITPVIAWFMGLSMVNQFAAAANPRGWAEAQATGDKAHMRDELEARAREWAAYLETLVER